jgi:hypothetical protein
MFLPQGGILMGFAEDERKKEVSQEILRTKFPATKGLSAETAEDVEAGLVEIEGDEPQTEMLRDQLTGE